MKVFNVTNLPEDKNIYTFNPSIAHWKDDLFLCAYRTFVRYPKLKQTGKDYDYTRHPNQDPNHPWLGSDKSETWWYSYDGKDETKLSLLSIKSEKTKSVKKYDNGSMTNNKSKIVKHINGVDARLLKLDDDTEKIPGINKNNSSGTYFLLSYNASADVKTKVKDTTCIKGCFLIAARILFIEHKTKNIKLYPQTIICPEISNTLEKNWSFWVYDGCIYFSYGVHPVHDIYKIRIVNNCELVCDKSIHMTNTPFMDSFSSFYKGKVFISVTTPAIPITKRRYCAVGHIKWKYKDVLNKGKNTPLKEYSEYIIDKFENNHPVYLYMMYFYIFDPSDGKIIGISDMFIPKGSSSSLCFPSGITYTKDGKIMVSYGDTDSQSKYFIINRRRLSSLIKKTNDIKPNDIQFIILS